MTALSGLGSLWHQGTACQPTCLSSTHVRRCLPCRVYSSTRRRGPRELIAAASSRSPLPAQQTQRSPAAKAAIFTGTYATIAGIALVLAPQTVFGLLFNAQELTVGWIRVGGVLFALIGMQYLGTGLGDTLLPHTTSSSSPPSGQNTTNTGSSSNSFSTEDRAVQRSSVSVYARGFYQGTIWSRLFLSAGFAWLVASGQSPWGLLILAAINTLGAMTMWFALQRTDSLLQYGVAQT